MTLPERKYKSCDTLRLTYEASPVSMALYAALPVVQSAMQTAITALATAHFVDTATSILQSARPYQDIYPALAVMLITLGFVNTIGSLAKLAAAKASVNLKRCLEPAIVKISASLDYKHNDNIEIQKDIRLREWCLGSMEAEHNSVLRKRVWNKNFQITIGIWGGLTMFISIAILFIICGILLLLKAKKMPNEQGLHIITGVGAIVLIILGVILTYCILSGKIVLPLY